jgi:hypothetical protein
MTGARWSGGPVGRRAGPTASTATPTPRRTSGETGTGAVTAGPATVTAFDGPGDGPATVTALDGPGDGHEERERADAAGYERFMGRWSQRLAPLFVEFPRQNTAKPMRIRSPSVLFSFSSASRPPEAVSTSNPSVMRTIRSRRKKCS